MALTLRIPKGSPLTYAECDANFSGLADGSNLDAIALAAKTFTSLTLSASLIALNIGTGASASEWRLAGRSGAPTQADLQLGDNTTRAALWLEAGYFAGTADSSLPAVFIRDTGSSIGRVSLTSNPASVFGWSSGANDAAQALDTQMTRAAEKLVMISGDGVGASGLNTGWKIGYGGNSGIGAIYLSYESGDQNSARFWANSLNTVIGTGGYTGSSVFKVNVGAAVTKFQVHDLVGWGADIIAGTAVSDVNALNITQTWNNGAVAFTAIKADITDTASDAASLLMDLQVGSVSKFKINKAGGITAPGDHNFASSVTAGYIVLTSATLGVYQRGASSAGFVMGAADDTNISRISAGVIGVGTGAAASIAGSLSLTNITAAGTLTYGGVTLSASVTGTGKMVLDTSPTITGGTITGITDIAVADGGTGSSTADAARAALSAEKTITVSTSAPSGGSDGDIWFVREA